MPQLSPLSWVSLYFLIWVLYSVVVGACWWVSSSYQSSFEANKKSSSWLWW